MNLALNSLELLGKFISGVGYYRFRISDTSRLKVHFLPCSFQPRAGMAVARPEGAAAPSELPMSMLSKKMSQNQWARMQGVLGVKTAYLSSNLLIFIQYNFLVLW